jgi:hypothetical protein
MILVSILLAVVTTPITTNALSFPPAFPPYKSFGGRVLSYVPPPVATCIGLGSLVYTSSSITPIYTTNPLKFPTMGGKILGSISKFPSLTTCFNPASGVPIPVSLTTSNYGVSFK